jgi:hypothetical protein
MAVVNGTAVQVTYHGRAILTEDGAANDHSAGGGGGSDRVRIALVKFSPLSAQSVLHEIALLRIPTSYLFNSGRIAV